MLPAGLAAALQAHLGSAVVGADRLSGGDINQAFSVRLTDGRRLFVKTHPGADPRLFPAEARGLRWLAEPGVIRVPEVLAVSGGGDGSPGFLALELLLPGRRRPDFDERLGHALAALHRAGADRFGLDHDNFIGSLPQSNRPSASWEQFYRERRLEPQVSRAGRLLGATLEARFERLYARLGDLLPPAEPPARLHGDLWGGNLHTDAAGEPALIDPAAYAGAREVDLAMMRLFGGFGSKVFEAYAEAWPLAPGAAERVHLYQLYPLLVHVNLFGAGYVASVARALDALRIAS